ncbi:BatA domain-containing protein, partial [Corallococcus llansteffanensis]
MRRSASGASASPRWKGALGALIPVLVHLFDRRRPRAHPFGPMAFVLRSQKRTASRLK